MRITLSCILVISGFISQAQNPTWADDVANIVYDNCSKCHHVGGINSSIPLMSYADAYGFRFMIEDAAVNRRMPPWPADPDYRHFAFEEVLDSIEIQTIVDWVANGAPEGNPANAPAPPTFIPGGSLLDTIDMTIQIPPYTLQYNTDEYRWFAFTNPFGYTVYVNQIEVIPTLDEAVHHADISYDLTNQTMNNDNNDPLPGFNQTTGVPNYSYYMNAWQPGGNIAQYPENWGIAVPPGADFVFEIHYGPGYQGQTDTTKMNLKFVADTTSVRSVQVGWLLNESPGNMIDGPLVIPANTQQSFHQQYTLSSSMSFIAICPHMHLLGKSYKVWAITPTNDTIHLVDIPQWDFHWQKYYTFREVQVLPVGTTIYSEGWYDNTINNPNNPFNPPQTVTSGGTTLDEMFLCYFIYAPYQFGDENVVLDSSWALSNERIAVGEEHHDLKIWPNPSRERVTISAEQQFNQVKVFDTFGRLCLTEGIRSTPFSLDISALSKGTYFLRFSSSEITVTRKVVKL